MDTTRNLYKEAPASTATKPRPPDPPIWAAQRPPPPQPPSRTWRLKANCALSPRQFMASIGALMGASSIVAICCALRGLWLVPVFCGAELLVIAVAALAYARHAIDGETVTLTCDGLVLVEADRGLRRTSHVFQLGQARLVRPDTEPGTLWLCQHTRRVRLGQHAPPAMLAAFESDLRQRIRMG
jgi:uncharacterized membrane protein